MYSGQLIIDADMTPTGWEVVLRFTAEDMIAAYSDVPDDGLAEIIGVLAAEALVASRNYSAED